MDFKRFVELIKEAETGRPPREVFQRGGLGVFEVRNSSEAVTFVNTTPHPVSVFNEADELVLAVREATDPLRLQEETVLAGYTVGIKIVSKALVGVDEEDVRALRSCRLEGVNFIVPLLVAQAVRYEKFLVPDESLRDDQGKIIGCRRFAVVVG